MKHITFKQSAAVLAILSVLTIAGPRIASAYFGGGFVSGAVVATPTPAPTETPEVLGASTVLPNTGLSLRDALVLTLSACTFVAGIATTTSGLRK